MTTIKYRDPVTGQFQRASSGGSGGASSLDGLTDVTAPVDTPAGKVLGTTATGAWGPVAPAQEVVVGRSEPTDQAVDLWVDTAATGGAAATVALLDALVPIGTIHPYAGGATPPGGNWMLAQGQAVSRTTYPVLFARIGTAHGAGDGSTTFNLPNLMGRVVTGIDLANHAVLGGKGGAETHLHPLTSGGWANISIIGPGVIQQRLSSVTTFTSGLMVAITPQLSGGALSDGTATGLGGNTNTASTEQPFINLHYIIRVV